MNKKMLGLVGFALVTAFALEAVARPTNSWNFKTLLLQPDQTLNVQGTILSPLPTTQTMAAGDSIVANACGGIKQIQSVTGAISSSTTFPFTAAATANAGCDMSVVNVGASTITIKAAALQFFPLNAADVVLGSSSTVTVISNGTFWYQTGGTVNR